MRRRFDQGSSFQGQQAILVIYVSTIPCDWDSHYYHNLCGLELQPSPIFKQTIQTKQTHTTLFFRNHVSSISGGRARFATVFLDVFHCDSPKQGSTQGGEKNCRQSTRSERTQCQGIAQGLGYLQRPSTCTTQYCGSDFSQVYPNSTEERKNDMVMWCLLATKVVEGFFLESVQLMDSALILAKGRGMVVKASSSSSGCSCLNRTAAVC